MSDVPELLRNLATLWLRQVKHAKQAKAEAFGNTAEELWKFLGASWRELYVQTSTDPEVFKEYQFPGAEQATYKPRINLSGKYVMVMLPYILARIPNRLVTPRRPQLPKGLLDLANQATILTQQAIESGEQPAPVSEVVAAIARAAPHQAELQLQDEARAFLMEWFLNYLPGAYGLMREAKMALIEALVKGRGVLWHEMVEGPTGEIPGSFYDTVDNQFLDGDAKQYRTAGYMIRRREQAIWEIAEKFGITDQAVLRGSRTSRWESAAGDVSANDEDTSSTDGNGNRKRDIGVYYEIWSRVGIGQRFYSPGDEITRLKDTLEALGPHVYLAVMDGVPYPLNLQPHLLGGAGGAGALREALAWDLPTYENIDDPWPCSKIDFLPDSESPWAISNLRAALPLQVFIDHLYAFLMGGAARRCKSLVLAAKELEDKLREALATGTDMQIVYTNHKTIAEIRDLLHVVDFTRMNPDLWQLVPLVQEAFEEMTGVSPLLTHGGVGPTQPRSATEMTERSQRANSRPDDFADCVEEWHSAIAAKEGQLTRMHVTPTVISPLLGEDLPDEYDPEDEASRVAHHAELGPLSQLWAVLVNTPDEARAAAELSYVVEHSTGRRKNRQKVVEDIQAISQHVVPLLTWYMNSPYWTGDTTQVNEYLRMIEKGLEAEEVSRMQLPDMTVIVQQVQAAQQAQAAAQETSDKPQAQEAA